MAKQKRQDVISEHRALDILTQESNDFQIEDINGEQITLHLHPLQLGRLAMISKRLIALDLAFDDEQADDAVRQMWRICTENAHRVAEIIAIATLRTKSDIDEKLAERTDLILHSPTMTPTALTNVLSAIVFQSYHADFMTAIRSVRTLRVVISPTTEAERIAPTADGASGDK